MNIVNNIWNKAPNPFKSDSQENNDLTNNVNQDQTTNNPEDVNAEDAAKDSSAFNIAGNITGNITGQVSGATNYVSNIFKSTFKGDSGESKSRKESLESTNETREAGSKKESLTTGASNLLSGVSNVWSKSTSIFNKQNEQQQQADDTAKTEDEQIQYDDEANLIDNNQKENVSQKAIDSAKNFGNLMFSFANKAGQTVSATAKQTTSVVTSVVKKTVENTNLFADFTKEQQEFIKEHGGNITIGEPPWVGCEDEEEMKKQILSLSQDKRNFVRQPPAGVQFDFDLQQMLPVCLILLKEDENLNKMRFEIVPKLVNEDSFWRNYFYRVSLIKQSNSLNNMTCSKGGRQSSSESEGPDDIPDDNPEPEFVSDYIQGNVTEEDVVSGMRAMGVSKTDSIKDDKKWEDELAKDLQEFEVVNKDCNDIKSTFDAELAKELDEIK